MYFTRIKQCVGNDIIYLVWAMVGKDHPIQPTSSRDLQEPSLKEVCRRAAGSQEVGGITIECVKTVV